MKQRCRSGPTSWKVRPQQAHKSRWQSVYRQRGKVGDRERRTQGDRHQKQNSTWGAQIQTECVEAGKLIRYMADPTHTPCLFISFFPCPIMQSREEAGMTSRRLCFCLDLWIEFLQASTIKYGIEIAPLFLLRHRGQSTQLAPLCSLFSSERITSCAFSITHSPTLN